MSENRNSWNSPSLPIKVMGERHEEFVVTITEVVRVNAPDLADHDVTLRESSNGRFTR